MRTCLLAALVLAAGPAAAQRASPAPVQQQSGDLLEQVQKERAARTQQQIQERRDRARENCIANRGMDCDTDAGLQEWLMLERSRAEAVLDRVSPEEAASAGASRPPAAR